MYNRILLPTDGTELCERAIRHGIALAKLAQAKLIGVTVTHPLHSALPRSFIPKNLAAIIHSETVKVADEKLAVVRRLAGAEGVEFENVRQSRSPSGGYPSHSQGQAVRFDRDGIPRTARSFRRCTGQRDAEGADSRKHSRAGG